MVEVILWCTAGHEFTQLFEEPIDWGKVNAAVKATTCINHTPVPYFDYNDCYGD